MSVAPIRDELKKVWDAHPEARNALREGYKKAGANYKSCIRITDKTVTIDRDCYRSQAVPLSSEYKKAWGSE